MAGSIFVYEILVHVRCCYGLNVRSPPLVANQDTFAIAMMRIHKMGGAKDKPDNTAASVFLRLRYAIHELMMIASGRSGYDQTMRTKVHASGVEPWSNAMTESPAMTSQITSEPAARSWEMIIQIRRPVHLRGWGVVSVINTSKSRWLSSPSPSNREANRNYQ